MNFCIVVKLGKLSLIMCNFGNILDWHLDSNKIAATVNFHLNFRHWNLHNYNKRSNSIVFASNINKSLEIILMESLDHRWQL